MATTITPDTRLGGPADSSDPAAPSGTPADGKNERGSLRPVLEVIPPEAYENPTWKGLAYFGPDLVVYGLVVWGLVAFANPLVVLPLLVVAGLTISGLF